MERPGPSQMDLAIKERTVCCGLASLAQDCLRTLTNEPAKNPPNKSIAPSKGASEHCPYVSRDGLRRETTKVVFIDTNLPYAFSGLLFTSSYNTTSAMRWDDKYFRGQNR